MEYDVNKVIDVIVDAKHLLQAIDRESLPDYDGNSVPYEKIQQEINDLTQSIEEL